MKIQMGLFIEKVFKNLILWGIILSAYVILSKTAWMKSLYVVIGISILIGCFEALKQIFTKKRKNGLKWVFQGLLGGIYLILISGTIIMIIHYVKDKRYPLLGLFIGIMLILYYKVNKIFEKPKS